MSALFPPLWPNGIPPDPFPIRACEQAAYAILFTTVFLTCPHKALTTLRSDLALAEIRPGRLVGTVTFRFTFRRYSLPFRQPVRTAHGLWTEREGLLLRLETTGGRIGFGDAAPIPWFGTETVEDAEAVCQRLGGEYSEAVDSTLPDSCPCLRFAFASALARLREPAPAAAASTPKPALPVSALLPAGRAALSLIAARAEAGFRTFKWKVGVGAIADELSLLDDLLAALPEGARLRLDANGAWDRRQAERWLERCAERPIEFVEQPCFVDHTHSAAERAKNVDLLLGLASEYPTPLALDESVVSGSDVNLWLDRGWPGLFVLKPALLGDPAAILERLSRAKARVVFSSALETAVGARAALQLAFSHSNKNERLALGFGVWPLFRDGRLDGPTLAPFIREQDVAAIDEEAAWNALG